jgi:DNA polymerase III epsilon subunit-like protein
VQHISIDLETLGTVADAVILSIGAVRFDPFSDAIDDNGFYASISIESNLDANRRIQEDTLLWWMKQSAAAQNVFFEPKNALENALIDFSEWVGHDQHCMWSNGADFDLPMLAHAFTQHKLTIPWKHWNSRCVRTVKELPLAKGVTVPRTGTHHNALYDAIYQAKLVQAITKVMKGKVAA